MALDKQRILSELGSVMNQLQSADCGCMGKLFNNNPGACPRGNPLPTCGGCRRGYCPGHGYDVNNASMQGAGDPYGMKGGMGGGMGGMHGGGMGGMHRGGMGGMHGGGMGGMSGGGMGGMHGGGMGGMSGGGMGGMSGGGMGGMSGGGMGGMSGGGMGGMSGGGMGGMSGGGMGGMSGGGMGGMSGGGMGGMSGGGMDGMQGGGMADGGMADGGMADGGMNMGGGMPAGGMSGGSMAGVGMNMGGGMRGGGMRGGGMSAMGRNIPALYADTYNYLNQNLMQPCVKEVYNDLNTITPQNTIAANPLATQMGLPPPGSGGAMPAGDMGNPVQNAGGVPGGNPMGNLSGMGANIVNMMMKGGGGRPANMGANSGGQLRDPMLIDAPNSPHGQVGVTPLTSPTGAGNMGMDANAAPGQPNAGMGMSNMAPGGMQVPTTQYVTQDNMYTPANVTNVQGNAMAGNTAPQGNMVPGAQGSMYPGVQGNMNPGNQRNMNPGAQQLTNHQRYGHHTQGITKFHEMFPGTMQEGLNFDPMAIAIQMNPANQKKAAMDTITKLMSGESAVKMGQPKQQTAPAMDPNAAPGQVGNQQYIQGQQQIAAPGAIQPNQQQLYTAQTGAPVMNQQIPQQQLQGQQYQQIPPQQQLQGQQYQQILPQQQLQGQQYQQIPPQQQIQGQQYQQLQPGQQQIDPNTGAVITPDYEGGAVDSNAQMQQPPPNAIATQEQPTQEIYPADNSKNVFYSSQNPNYHYNTLGQPVEYLPKENYRSPEPGLPQTLYGDYRQDLAGGYGVKNTMSKTALAGTRPIGRTASKSQLQHIYRQYRASHTNVQQSIKPPMYTGSASVGRLNMAPPQPMAQQPMAPMPVEKVGGDTLANNPVGQPMAKMGAPVMGETGDVIPTNLPNAPPGDALFEKSYGAIMQKRGRNGLQDHSYRPYRQSAGWSFHG